MICLNVSGNRYDAILNTVCFQFSVLEGRTAGRRRNPVININILLSHKYFSSRYGCVHFLKDHQLSLFKLPESSFPAHGFLPALGAGNQR